jgi:putative zinc finger protein
VTRPLGAAILYLGDAPFVDCATVKSRLSGLVSGTLTPEEKAETAAHLASCEGCRLEHHLLQAIHGTGTSGSETPSPEPPGIHSSREPMSDPKPHVPPPPPPQLVPPAADTGLTLESMTPTMSAPDPEVSFADVGLTSPALATGSNEPDSRRTEDSAVPSLIPGPPKKAWDFEPVDPPRSSSPPEESLNFAEEALNRSSRREGSRAVFRVVLWSCGAVAGVALLAVSVWMAMAHRESPGDAQTLAPPPPSHVADSVAVRSAAPKESTSVPAPAMVAPAPSMTPAPATAPQPKTQVQPGGTPVAGTSGPVTKASTPKLSPPPPVSSKAGPKAAASTSGGQAASASHGTEPSAPQTAPSPAPPRRGPPTREEGFEPVTDGPADTKATWSQSDFTPAPTQTQRKPTTSTSRPTVLFEPAPEEARPATPPDEVDTSGPVGRLHLATVKAHEDRDLEALRKIKASWKSYLRTALGVDRERAKREMADCLWAIQEITGRDADRKEALTAYREYVLHAPAGGADARTISRMRHLEDVLSDSQ